MIRRRILKGRHVVGLLLVATTINYIDRQTLSVLAPLLEKELHLSSLPSAVVPFAAAIFTIEQTW